MSVQPVKEVADKMAKLPNYPKPLQTIAEHATDFEPPIYRKSKSNCGRPAET